MTLPEDRANIVPLCKGRNRDDEEAGTAQRGSWLELPVTVKGDADERAPLVPPHPCGMHGISG
jgi:hypothetical protein